MNPAPTCPPPASNPIRRARGLYIAFGVLAGLSVFLACAALLDWPAAAKPLTLALLILLLLSWILVLVLTIVLRCGSRVQRGHTARLRLPRPACLPHPALQRPALPTHPLVPPTNTPACAHRAGNDVCVNLEPKAIELVGSSSLSLGGAGGGSGERRCLVLHFPTACTPVGSSSPTHALT